ncbi:HNH endonuclease [Actinacidiphila paucisporea]|uniref:HNH endonuclease n=1 Tax=Actinacidiphila paucisporea TaxID=310782 RepID=A0A1M7PZ19_9ACTN|nr:HNH endonuclease signature motif containing protein [Actinacidiphila paucisporea]SHN22979.1 HNH endonuclease [Actinacidiphila paucisporea]
MSRKKQEMWIRLMVLIANMGRCVYCDHAESQVVDHVVPFKGRGSEHWLNLVPACEPCNVNKSAKGVLAWVAELAYLRHAAEASPYPHGDKGIWWMRERLDNDFDEVIARIEGVKAELEDEARRDWFFEHFWRLKKNDPAYLWRGWAQRWADKAREEGWPKPPPKRMRITRKYFGRLFEEIPADETV